MERIGFFIPAIVSRVFIQYVHGFTVMTDYSENMLTALLVVIGCNLFGRNKVSLGLELFFLGLINFLMFVEIVHLYLYKSYISASTMFIIVETNGAEASEFLSMYVDYKLLLVALFMLVTAGLTAFLMIKRQQKSWSIFDYRLPLPWTKFKLNLNPIFFLIALYIFINDSEHLDYFLPHTAITSYQVYKKDMVKYEQLGFNKTGGNFSKVKHQESNKDEVYVLLIGEATTRQHMGLYAYDRPTNPILTSMKDELVIYDDVISPHTHTIPSLNKVLTLANLENPKQKFSGSILQLFNKAGFKTYWISNQRPSGMFDTAVTAISNSCEERFFTNTSSKVTPFDEQVLIPLEKVLAQKNKKKLIVIHLMGTHGKYHNRYPKSFEQFTSKPETIFKYQQAYDIINEYDNAVLYNDFVVSEIIHKVKQSNTKSSIVYFSDHGEEVFHSQATAGHTEKDGTKPMYDIPFIIWLSEEYKQEENDLVFDIQRKYITDDIIYTMADIAQVKFVEFDSTRSIVNPHFIERERNISYKLFNYDEVYKKAEQ